MSEDSAFEIGRLYPPLRQIADTLVASQEDIFVRLPGLRGYYPMGIRNSSGNVVDHSNADASLVQTGICPVGYDGDSFAHLGNGTNYLGGGSSFAITGAETFITAALNGLTVGGWFMIDSLPAANAGLISRSGLTPDYGYTLDVNLNGQHSFGMSGNGAATFAASSIAVAISVWRFIVGRFIPSTEVAVFVDGDKTANTTAIPATCFVSTASFEVGRHFADNTRIAHAKARDVFVCASALSDALIEEIRTTSGP